jgi:hypothetical protein
MQTGLDVVQAGACFTDDADLRPAQGTRTPVQTATNVLVSDIGRTRVGSCAESPHLVFNAYLEVDSEKCCALKCCHTSHEVCFQ